MAEEKLRRNLDEVFDPGPDFPHPLWLSQTIAALGSEAHAADRRPMRRRPEWFMPAVAFLLAVAVVVALIATAEQIRHMNSTSPATHQPQSGLPQQNLGAGLQPPVALHCSQQTGPGCVAPPAPVFASQAVGWMTAGYGAPYGPINLYRTNDGGRQWQALFSWSGREAGQIVISPDRQQILVVTVWAHNPSQLILSTDGGSHWKLMNLPTPSCLSAGSCSPGPQPIYFLNPQEGWVLWQEGNRAQLFHTTDSGANWSTMALVDVNADFALDLSLGQGLTGRILFTSSSLGWFIPSSNGGSAARDPFIYRTVDGGVTWKSLTLTPPNGINTSNSAILDVKFFDSRTGVLELSGANGGPSPTYLYFTTDSGAIWNGPQRITKDIVADHASGSGLDFIDRSHWIGYLGADGLLETNDGGTTWTVVSPPNGPTCAESSSESCSLPFGGYYVRLQFVDSAHGWMSSWGGGLIGSSDGGRHWTRLGQPNTG